MPEPRTLRPYQAEAVQAVFNEWGTETRRTAVVLPTGTGKSTVIGKIAAESARMGLRVVMLAHRGELLDQMAATVTEVDPDINPVGIVRADIDEHDRPIVAASFQTVANDSRLARIGHRDVLLVDECFVAGTAVDGRPIETLRVGDSVTAWSEDGHRTRRHITAVMSSVPSALVRVTTTSNESFACTPGHPFLTPLGWVPAGELSHGVSLHHANAMQTVRRDGGRDHEVSAGPAAETGVGVLLEDMQYGISSGDQLTHNGGHEPSSRFLTYAGTQSDAPAGGPRAGVAVVESDGASAVGTHGQRRTAYGSASSFSGGIELGNGGGCADDGWREAIQVLRGHRQSRTPHRRGSGRQFPQGFGSHGCGRTPDSPTGSPRVACVEVLEPGSDGRYGGVCPDGLVYNIEVDTDHTYTVGSGIVVHNCHHVTADSYRAVVESFGIGAFFCGFTATLRREDGKALNQLIDSIAYEKDIRWAIDQGYLVRPRGITVKIPHLDLGKVKTTAGDFQSGELADVMEAETPEIVKAILRHCQSDGYRPIIFAASVDAAHAIADELSDHGMTAEAVTGSMSYDDRQPVYDRYRSGDSRALVTVQVLTEGADFPMCDAVVIARPTQSQNLYSQMVGRSLRLYPGKTDALVLDLVGTARVLKLVTLSSLDAGGTSRTVNTDGEELEDDPLDAAGLEVAEPKPRMRRMGPIDTIGIDLLGEDATDSLWLGTIKGVPFMSPAQADFVVFLWEYQSEGETRYRAGYMSKAGEKTGGWISSTGHTVKDAQKSAEAFVLQQDFIVPKRDASWRKTSAPSEAQLRYARTLGILDAELMSRSRLSDEISIELMSRRLDAAR